MLGRIINISTNTELKQSRKSHGFGKYMASAYAHHNDVHDSVSLSPALIFLNENKWHLKDIEHLSPEKIMLFMVINGLELVTTIDLANLRYIQRLEYDILKERELNGEISKALAHFSVKLTHSKFEEFGELIIFNGLKSLFDRIFLLDLDCELNSSELKIIQNLLDGIYGDIQYEFDYLNSGIITFIEKLKGTKLSGQVFTPVSEDSVTLLKIKTSNAEISKPERIISKRML